MEEATRAEEAVGLVMVRVGGALMGGLPRHWITVGMFVTAVAPQDQMFPSESRAYES
jgi:hypothetical protein